jgi:hypothetical protein
MGDLLFSKGHSMKELKEESWGYFRPGFYPLEKHNVVPAMICLGEAPYHREPNIQFVLVKADCYLKAWQDALLVSEKDFDQIINDSPLPASPENPSEKIKHLMEKFIGKGYLPLNKVKAEVTFNALH